MRLDFAKRQVYRFTAVIVEATSETVSDSICRANQKHNNFIFIDFEFL